MSKQNEKYYTVQEAAKLLGVHRNTIFRWIASGLITSRRASPAATADHLIPASELEPYIGIKQDTP